MWETLRVASAIIVGEEVFLPVVPALGDVARNTGQDNARQPRLERILFPRPRIA
jgi:hypothetical protein